MSSSPAPSAARQLGDDDAAARGGGGDLFGRGVDDVRAVGRGLVGEAGKVEAASQGLGLQTAHEHADAGEQLGLAAVGDDDAAADDDQVVGDDLDLVQQVRGQQDGPAALGERP